MALTASVGDERPKILVVDDELPNLQKLRRTLVGQYSVLPAQTAGEALRLLESHPDIAVIIADQRMPDMTGVDLLRQSLSTHPHAIRLILTGFTDVEVLMDAINTCKVFRYLVKPWEPNDLLVTIERGLETYQLSLENERFRRELIRRERVARELEIAREIQRFILPTCCPRLPGYELAVEYHPAAEVGGDLYDFHDSEGAGVLQAVVGDVSGKSIPAALYGAVFSGQLRALFEQRKGPAELLSFLNRNLIGRTARANYIAVTFLRLELGSGRLTFANAGLPYPYLVHCGRVTRLEFPGAPLGLLEDSEYSEMTAELLPGDILLIASDGCTEVENRNGDPFEEERLAATIERNADLGAAELLKKLYKEISRFAKGSEPQDDITMLAIRRADQGRPQKVE